MITVTELEDSKDKLVGFAIIVDAESIESLRSLVQRGANLWPDAPAEVKEFADKITSGKVLQDYRTQDTSRKKACAHEWKEVFRGDKIYRLTCDKCGNSKGVINHD